MSKMADQEKDMLKQRPLQFQKTPGNHQLWTEIEYIDCDPIIIHAE